MYYIQVQEKVKKVDADQEVLLLQVVVHHTENVESAVQEENIADHLQLQVVVQVFLNPEKNAQEKIRNLDLDLDPDLDPDHLMTLNVGQTDLQCQNPKPEIDPKLEIHPKPEIVLNQSTTKNISL